MIFIKSFTAHSQLQNNVENVIKDATVYTLRSEFPLLWQEIGEVSSLRVWFLNTLFKKKSSAQVIIFIPLIISYSFKESSCSISVSLFHVELLFFSNAGWNKMDRSSHSEATTVFRNKFPAVSDRASFVSLFFLSKLLILLSTLYTFLQVTENKKSFFSQRNQQILQYSTQSILLQSKYLFYLEQRGGSGHMQHELLKTC